MGFHLREIIKIEKKIKLLGVININCEEVTLMGKCSLIVMTNEGKPLYGTSAQLYKINTIEGGWDKYHEKLVDKITQKVTQEVLDELNRPSLRKVK